MCHSVDRDTRSSRRGVPILGFDRPAASSSSALHSRENHLVMFLRVVGSSSRRTAAGGAFHASIRHGTRSSKVVLPRKTKSDPVQEPARVLNDCGVGSSPCGLSFSAVGFTVHSSYSQFPRGSEPLGLLVISTYASVLVLANNYIPARVVQVSRQGHRLL